MILLLGKDMKEGSRAARGREGEGQTKMSRYTQKDLSFPRISSILVTFPIVKSKRNEIKSVRKRQSILELDKYLESAQQNHEEYSRFIFANPLRNTIILHKTINNFTDITKSKQSLSISGALPKKHNCSSLSPVKSKRQDSSLGFKESIWKQMSVKGQQKSKFEKKKKMDESARISRSNLIVEKYMQIRRGQRYSPWRQDHLEDQLII